MVLISGFCNYDNGFRLILKIIPSRTITLVIEDFIAPRDSKKTPSTELCHDHAQLANRSQFFWRQMRVALGFICTQRKRHAAFPLLLKLIRNAGNTSKLDAARLHMKCVLHQIPSNRTVRLLLDALYMKEPLLIDLIRGNVAVIGELRRDTALYLLPPLVIERCAEDPGSTGNA